MQINAKLPFLVRGVPVKKKGPRDVFVSRDFSWDIPEVSSSEVELVFENFKAFLPNADPSDPIYRLGGRDRGFYTFSEADSFSEVDSYTCAIKHDGSLYRRVSSDGDNIVELFRYAFPSGCHYSFTEDISLERGTPISDRLFYFPASLPVFRHFRWRRECDAVGTWPGSIKIPEAEARAGPWWDRNFKTFEDVLPQLPEFDHDQMQECLRTYQGHMTNFLLVDGQLWMKTRPPVYKVSSKQDAGTYLTTVSLAFAPDAQDTHLTNAYFSLEARDEAFEYANFLRGMYATREFVVQEGYAGEGYQGNGLESVLIDLTSKYVAFDTAAMAYDYQTEELRRIASALAVSTRYSAVRRPGWMAGLGEAVVDDLHKAFAEVQATNYILGEYGDPSEWLTSTIKAWEHTGRESNSYYFGSTALRDLMIERAMRLEENKPISVAGIVSSPII